MSMSITQDAQDLTCKFIHNRESREIVNVAVTTEETTNSGNEEWGGESTAAY